MVLNWKDGNIERVVVMGEGFTSIIISTHYTAAGPNECSFDTFLLLKISNQVYM